MGLTLQDLPIEILYDIHLFALNAHLAQVSFRMYLVLHGLPPTMQAQWLEHFYIPPERILSLTRGRTSSIKEALESDSTFAPRYFSTLIESCLGNRRATLPILKVMHRRWNPYISSSLVIASRPSRPSNEQGLDRQQNGQLPPTELAVIRVPPTLFKRICICHEVEGLRTGQCRIRGHSSKSSTAGSEGAEPTRSRIGAYFTTVQDTLEQLEILFNPSLYNLDSPSPFPTIHKPKFSVESLTLAAASSSIRLVKYILRKSGVDPSRADGMAVKAAIRKKDLMMVKVLIEKGDDDDDEVSPELAPEEGSSPDKGMPLKRRKVTTGKRRRLGDRMDVTKSLLREALQADARAVVAYFIDEKGCTPDATMLARTLF